MVSDPPTKRGVMADWSFHQMYNSSLQRKGSPPPPQKCLTSPRNNSMFFINPYLIIHTIQLNFQYHVGEIQLVATFWLWKNISLVSIFSAYTEYFYISISEINSICTRWSMAVQNMGKVLLHYILWVIFQQRFAMLRCCRFIWLPVKYSVVHIA